MAVLFGVATEAFIQDVFRCRPSALHRGQPPSLQFFTPRGVPL